MRCPERAIVVRDVTLREYAQNLDEQGAEAFSPERRLWLARRLLQVGFTVLEVASTASPKLVPAMAPSRLRPFLDELGHPPGVDLVTLVPPSRSAARRFFDLGLGSKGHDHLMGLFVSAVEDHNRANLGLSIDEALRRYDEIAREARDGGTRVVGYVSGAFGYRTPDGRCNTPSVETVAELVRRMASFGAENVTLSDLQGVADPRQTSELFLELTSLFGDRLPLGYHGHHMNPEAGLDNALAAAEAGVCLFDGSLGAVGGCITGEPGNVPTEGLVRRLSRVGFEAGLSPEDVETLAREVGREIYLRDRR